MEGLKANLMGSPSIMRSLQLFLNDSSKNCRVDDATKKEKKCQSNNQAIKNVNTYWLDSSSCTLRALRSVLVGLSPRPSDASSYGLQFLRLEQSFWIHPVLAFSALVRGEPSLTVVHETWGRIRGKVSIFFAFRSRSSYLFSTTGTEAARFKNCSLCFSNSDMFSKRKRPVTNRLVRNLIYLYIKIHRTRETQDQFQCRKNTHLPERDLRQFEVTEGKLNWKKPSPLSVSYNQLTYAKA